MLQLGMLESVASFFFGLISSVQLKSCQIEPENFGLVSVSSDSEVCTKIFEFC